MKLDQGQIDRFHNEGYVFLPGAFSADEVGVLRRRAEAILKMDRQEVWREKSGVARTAFAAHTYDEGFKRLGAHPRLVEPVMQLLDGSVYMHQFKINAKAAFDGEVWQWHQDFGTWHRDDEMPEPRAMNIALFLDEVSAVNGPLMFIPGSHRAGTLEAGHDLESTSYPLWTLSRDEVSRLADEGGCVAPTGPAGSVIMFHGNLVHASPPNISPFPRTIVYLSLCHVENHIRAFKRAEWIAHRDFTPIRPMADDCLSELAADERRAA
jgi:ectoine hydroxylase